jgi:hypothetical protein
MADENSDVGKVCYSQVKKLRTKTKTTSLANLNFLESGHMKVLLAKINH